MCTQCSAPAAPLRAPAPWRTLIRAAFWSQVPPQARARVRASELRMSRAWAAVAPYPGAAGREGRALGLGSGQDTAFMEGQPCLAGELAFSWCNVDLQPGTVWEQNLKGAHSQRWGCRPHGGRREPVSWSRPLGVPCQCGLWACAWEQDGVGGQDRKFLPGPEIFEPVIGAITAGGRCELQFKRSQPKALSAASWELPQTARTCPDSQKAPARGCNVTQMAGTVPRGSWRLLRCANTGLEGSPAPTSGWGRRCVCHQLGLFKAKALQASQPFEM